MKDIVFSADVQEFFKKKLREHLDCHINPTDTSRKLYEHYGESEIVRRLTQSAYDNDSCWSEYVSVTLDLSCNMETTGKVPEGITPDCMRLQYFKAAEDDTVTPVKVVARVADSTELITVKPFSFPYLPLNEDADTNYYFEDLICDLTENSKEVYFRNNGSHLDIIEYADYTKKYSYDDDLEYIFRSPYGFDFDLHVRTSEYDDKD